MATSISVDLEHATRVGVTHGLAASAICDMLGLAADGPQARLVALLVPEPRHTHDPITVERLITNRGCIHAPDALSQRRHIWDCLVLGMTIQQIVVVTKCHHRVAERMQATARRMQLLD